MKPTEVTIRCYIVIDGERWPLSVKAQVEAEDYNALRRDTDDMIRKLTRGGFELSAPRQSTPAGASTGRITPEPSSAALTWPAPTCPDCDKDMRVSKFQTDETKIYYHCPVRLPMGAYCLQCASVDNKSGQIKRWEVKK